MLKNAVVSELDGLVTQVLAAASFVVEHGSKASLLLVEHWVNRLDCPPPVECPLELHFCVISGDEAGVPKVCGLSDC